jgi:hypothetical protein
VDAPVDAPESWQTWSSWAMWEQSCWQRRQQELAGHGSEPEAADSEASTAGMELDAAKGHGLRRAPGMELDALVAAINDEKARKQTKYLNKQNKF